MIQRPLCCAAIVVVQKAAEALSAANISVRCARFFVWFDEPVIQALVIPFAVTMETELADRIAQRPFAKEDHPIQAFGFQT